MDHERWKPVRGSHPRVWVSDLGRVRTARKGEWGGNEHSEGYRVVGLTVYGSRMTAFVHRLVLEAFRGPARLGLCARHLDGDKSNNRLDNLKWDSHPANLSDKAVHGTNSKAGLTPDDVREMRRRRDSGETLVSISKDFGVSAPSVGLICNRKRWKAVA